MRTSHVAILVAVGAIIIGLIAQAVTTRYVLSRAGVIGEQQAPASESTRTADLTGFDAVRLQGQWELTLTRGEEWHVEIAHLEDMSDRLEAEVVNDELRLTYRSPRGLRIFGFGLGGAGRARAAVVMPELARLRLEGASDVTLSGFEGEELTLLAFGAHQIEGAESRYDALELTLNGAVEALLRGVVVTDARVNLAGAVDVTLTLNGGALTGSMAGAGRLLYHGSVSEETVSVAGAARVERVE